MLAKKRISLTQKKKVYGKKKGIPRKSVRFIPKKKGEIIYRNPFAMRVPSKGSFSLKHVEWISQIDLLEEGKYGKVFWGKVKFKGITSPVRIALKQYKRDFVQGNDFPEILNRVKRSRVPQPKMILVSLGGLNYVLMEPYIKSAEVKVGLIGKVLGKEERIIKTKLKPNPDIIKALNLANNEDLELFSQAVNCVARLSKHGLYSERTKIAKNPGIDLFNVIQSASGKRRLVVQDLDSLRLNKGAAQNWKISAENLVEVVAYFFKANKRIALKIINETAQREGLPEIK